MAWEDLDEEQRNGVIVVLTQEAERLEREAMQLQEAAQRLGRPSLVERGEMRANAFREAIEALSR